MSFERSITVMMASKLYSITMSCAAIATIVPTPIAIPMSATARVGDLLIPFRNKELINLKTQKERYLMGSNQFRAQPHFMRTP
jgi:hypothetical protein